MVWTPGVTWKVWLTGVAADQLALPGWLAWMVQGPAAINVTVVPDTVHAGAVAAKITAKPEVAVPLTANGAEPKGWLASGAKVMVWAAGVAWKVWMTGVAAA
jgi:hypothetical protein